VELLTLIPNAKLLSKEIRKMAFRAMAGMFISEPVRV
jgi:hypothetical protein